MEIIDKSGGKYTVMLYRDGNLVSRRVSDDVVVGAMGTTEPRTPTPTPKPAPVPAPPQPPALPRTPDPLVGEQLPAPNERGVVSEVAREHPDLLLNSCQKRGGTWEFMEIVMERLRQIDSRWGWNCKRGDCSAISEDVVAFFHGRGTEAESQGSNEVYLFDIIVSHCPGEGATAKPGWGVAGTQNGAAWIYPRPANR